MRSILIAFLFISAVAPAAFAQRMPFTITGRAMLVLEPDVKKELKVTKAQSKQIEQAMKQLETDMQAGGMVDMMNPFAGLDVKLETILDEPQKQRLEELFIQSNGGFALADAKVAAVLSLSEEQSANVKQIVRTANQELLQMMASVRSKAAMKKVDQKRKDYEASAMAVLTEEQAAKLEQLKGKPFKFRS